MKHLINGVEKDVERVGIVQVGEPWCECLLEDGHVIRLRVVVMGVYRVVGETAPDGGPVYNVRNTVVMHVE